MMLVTCQESHEKCIGHILRLKLLLLTSNPIFMLFDNVKGSTGPAELAAVEAAASDSFCSRSLFFLFSSYKKG